MKISDQKVNAFLDEVVPQVMDNHRYVDPNQALRMLKETPEIARANVYTAAATGESETLQSFLREDPAIS